MMRCLLTLLFLFTISIGNGQNFRGQWKGSFTDKSVSAISWGGATSDYVLDLEVDGNSVTGFSYTYFTEDGRKYYTICRLAGTADRKKKYIEVTEVARTKTNVPDNIANSFQVHRLQWKKTGDNEILEGTWEPAPGQRGNTGFGTTTLMKRQLSEISPVAKRVNANKDPESGGMQSPFAKPLAKNVVPFKKSPIASTTTNPIVSSKTIVKAPIKIPVKDPVKVTGRDTITKIPEQKNSIIIAQADVPADFEKRQNAILQTVNVENASVRIEIYDNGEIDGDSISLFYNNKVLLAHKRLSEKPLMIELPVNNDDMNELVVYADNLGTIPPNTALMIVYDGNKRYEVRMTSDLKKSGTIRFIHKNKNRL